MLCWVTSFSQAAPRHELPRSRRIPIAQSLQHRPERKTGAPQAPKGRPANEQDRLMAEQLADLTPLDFSRAYPIGNATIYAGARANFCLLRSAASSANSGEAASADWASIGAASICGRRDSAQHYADDFRDQDSRLMLKSTSTAARDRPSESARINSASSLKPRSMRPRAA